MVKITSEILFVSWFILVIMLDKISTIFNISDYISSFMLLIISGIFLYATHKVNMKIKNNIKKDREAG